MSRLLLALVPCLVVIPHLVPLPEQIGSDLPRTAIGHFKDDGKTLPEADRLAALAEKDPVAFLEACLKRHEREVQGYTCTMLKQERINGRLEKPETVEVAFREKPHSVYMKWVKGERLAARALYVEGENKDETANRSMILVKPAGLGGRFVKWVTRDPRGKDSKSSGRYTIDEFGIAKGLESTLNTWKEASDDKALHVKFLGKKKIKELDNRECFVLIRDRFAKPDPEGIVEQIAYIDAETWMLTGSSLKGENGDLVAEYWFRDLRLNPKFDKDQFTLKAFEK